jgi:quinol monooxygenase YgiN
VDYLFATGSRPIAHRAEASDIASDIADDVDLKVVCATFDAAPGLEADLSGLLARWVVLTRGHRGCRNVDLLASTAQPGRYRIVEKWEDAGAMQAHLDSPDTAQLAQEMLPLLARAPELELYDAVSAHDLT